MIFDSGLPIEEPDLTPDPLKDLPKRRSQLNDLLHDWIEDLGIKIIKVRGTSANRRDQVLAGIPS